MSIDNARSTTFTRRQFVTGATGLAAAAGLAGADAAHAEQAQGKVYVIPETWDFEADLVIIGAGAAGYMAACAAHEKGASSLLLDKNHATGGDSAVSGCITIGPWPERTKADSGMDDDFDTWLADQKKSHPFSHHGLKGDPEATEHPFVERLGQLMPDTFTWMQDIAGATWVNYYYNVNCWTPQPTWDTVFPRDWTVQGGVIPLMRDLVEAYDDVEEMTSTEVTDIIQDESGRAIGVWAIDHNSKMVCAKANRAVIIATGTFNNNRHMMNEYLGYEIASVSPAANCASTGDGHIMAQRAGGYLRDMDLGTHWSSQTLANTSFVTSIMARHGSAPAYETSLPGIFVNLEGKRYASETLGYSLTAKNAFEQPHSIVWYVFDGQHSDEAPEDPSTEIMATADSLSELAKLMFVDPETFKAEVEQYNAYVEAGEDAAFGKYMNGCTKIEQAPFYAIAMGPRPYTTYGGIVVDLDGRVLTPEGEPIPSLYAAGLCCGSFAEQEGIFYLGGMSQALAFGRQAGQVAAAEEPWA